MEVGKLGGQWREYEYVFGALPHSSSLDLRRPMNFACTRVAASSRYGCFSVGRELQPDSQTSRDFARDFATSSLSSIQTYISPYMLL